MFDLFPNGECLEAMESMEAPRPLTIRTNTLKTKRRELAQALISRGVNVDPIDKWSKVGLLVYESQVCFGPNYMTPRPARKGRGRATIFSPRGFFFFSQRVSGGVHLKVTDCRPRGCCLTSPALV